MNGVGRVIKISRITVVTSPGYTITHLIVLLVPETPDIAPSLFLLTVSKVRSDISI